MVSSLTTYRSLFKNVRGWGLEKPRQLLMNMKYFTFKFLNPSFPNDMCEEFTGCRDIGPFGPGGIRAPLPDSSSLNVFLDPSKLLNSCDFLCTMKWQGLESTVRSSKRTLLLYILCRSDLLHINLIQK